MSVRGWLAISLGSNRCRPAFVIERRFRLADERHSVSASSLCNGIIVSGLRSVRFKSTYNNNT